MAHKAILVGLVCQAALLSGCATQTPVPVINGLGSKIRTVVTAQRPSAPVATHAGATKSGVIPAVAMKPAKPLMADERIAITSEPLDGPSSVKAPSFKVQAGESQNAITAAVDSKPEVTKVAPEPEMVTHKVLATDSVYKLARQYNTSTDSILKENGLKSTTDIKVGQVLTISSNSKPQISAWDDMRRMLSPTPMSQEGMQVAHKTGEISGEAVSTAAESKLVLSGQPAPKQVASIDESHLAAIEPAAGKVKASASHQEPDYVSYTVQPKETIYRISLKYNVSVLDIMAANDFAEPQDLKADAVIRVPVKKTLSQQLAAKDSVNDVAPAAGTPVVVTSEDKPVQVAMLSPAPVGAKEALREDLEAKAVKQEAFKDAVLPVIKDKPLSGDDAKKAEMKRGQVDPVAARTKGLVWPVKGQIVRRFGDDGSGVARTGINIAVPKDTPVLASEGGTVLYADDGLKIYGKLVLLRHDNGMVSAYAHNGYLLVKKNERVKKGQVIALSGASGNVESPQLHFELRQHASAIDPMRMLPSL